MSSSKKDAAVEAVRRGCAGTSEGRFPPEAVSDLHVVVPAQAAAVQVHGREVQDDLGKWGRKVCNGPHIACRPRPPAP